MKPSNDIDKWAVCFSSQAQVITDVFNDDYLTEKVLMSEQYLLG